MDQYTMQDPIKQYPQPDIPKQEQPEPGLDKELKPLADHGEKTYRGSDRLKGRKALITGADSGIGRAVAIAYAREGADLALSYLPQEQADVDELMKTLNETERKIIALPGDITDENFCKGLIDHVVDELGGLDILVNNAGKQIHVDNIADLTTEQLKKTFETNVYAMFWLCKAAIPHMPPGSAIINTASIQAYTPSPGLLDYAATKAAIVNFTKGLSNQLVKEKGIRVNAVAPGPIWTPLQPSHGQPIEKLPKFGEQTPMGRAGQPAELAPAFVFLASPESSYTTGEIIGVTGGQFLS